MTITASADVTWAILGAPAITGNADVTWAIRAATPSNPTLSGSADMAWAILAADPVPSGTLTGQQDVTWRIWGTDTFTVELTGAPTGLVGLLTVELSTVDTVVYGPTTSEIVEQPADSGRYVATIPFLGAGEYFVQWEYAGIMVTEPVTITERTVVFAPVPAGRISPALLTPAA